MWIIRVYFFDYLCHDGGVAKYLACYWRGDCPTDLLAYEVKRAHRYGKQNMLNGNSKGYHVVFGRE